MSWSTGVVGLAGAVIGACSTQLAAWLTRRAQRGAEREERSRTAAAEFAARFEGASDAVTYALRHVGDKEAGSNARHLTGELAPAVGRVMVNCDQTFSEAARDAATRLREAGMALPDGPACAENLFKQADAAYTRLREILERADGR